MLEFILLVILSVVLLVLYNKKKTKLHNNYKEELYQQYQKEYDRIKKEQEERITNLRGNTDVRIKQIETEEKYFEEKCKVKKDALEETIKQLEARKAELIKAHNEAVENEQEKIKLEVNSYKNLTLEKINQEIEKEKTEKTNKAAEELNAQLSANAELLAQKKEELSEVLEQINDYKKKQQVINEEILRRRQVEEQQDFYRIKLSDADLQDINYLLSIVDSLKNKTILYKLIWSEYLQRPFSTLFKNLSQGREIRCVIYKITNLNTGEIYIGKTKADVTKRWTEHIKTSLNIGTVSRTKIHGALFKHWHEFTFEVLEEVADEAQLSAREKFYINFYQSNICGYNITSGG